MKNFRLRSFSLWAGAMPALAVILAASAASAAPPAVMKVTSNGYLSAPGVNVMLYNSNFSPIFFDQKNAGMEIILHDQRIATNGAVRLLPTPEQWDPIPLLGSRVAVPGSDRLEAKLSYPAYQLHYEVVVTAEPGGFKVSVNLDQPLPASLVGRAGFNLEFLPSVYVDKSYVLDHGVYGVFPRYPEDRMTVVPGELKGEPYYTRDLHEAEGHTEPLPFATGQTITLAPADPLARITVTSETGPLELYDGRDLAVNGWYVLRTLIPAGKTQGAVVWRVRPHAIPGWTRPPVIAHSQLGYAPDFKKVAVIEMGRDFRAPATARLLRLEPDGSFHTVFSAPISRPTPWLRYNYARFDFSSVRRPGLYAIAYAGRRTHLFPIANGVYDHSWQTTLDSFLAVQMDHIAVRDGYHVWHGVAHMDDALQAPPNLIHFDGYRMGPNTFSPYPPGEHIPGLTVGGWFDAGDFDNDAFGQYTTIENLALAYNTFHMKWDELTVNEESRKVEMHRPDGVPDAVEQIEHGVLQTLAQIKAVGHTFTGIQAATLRQYTFVGDAASQTDGRVYNPKLGKNEIKGDESGKPDDRWAWTSTNPFMEYGAAAALAEASVAIKGWNDALAKQCLDAAIKLWNDNQGRPAPAGFRGFRRFGAPDWNAALELMIATGGAAPYKQRVEQLFPQEMESFAFGGWSAVRALPYLDASYRTQLEAAVKAYIPRLDEQLAATPFGVPPTRGDWGGSEQVAQFGAEMYFLHEAFPSLVGPQYTLRAANYLLGTHPAGSESYIAGIGAVSKLKTYSNNRGDHSYIPGGMVPGYVVLKPDFPECIPNFGMLWFEDETTVSAASSWVLEARAAEALTHAAAPAR